MAREEAVWWVALASISAILYVSWNLLTGDYKTIFAIISLFFWWLAGILAVADVEKYKWWIAASLTLAFILGAMEEAGVAPAGFAPANLTG